jgi:KaiC/GvpD/RAD55 family RecA-like ATPase
MTALSAFDRVCDALRATTGYEARGAKADWKCPAHADDDPSLSVSCGDKGCVVKCQAGCDTRDVMAALGLTMADLFDAPANNGRREEPNVTYPYVDEAGTLLFEVLRYPNKQFRQRRPDGNGGWVWKLGDVRRVLYRLPALIEGVAAGRTVFVVEGEKDVHAIESAGGLATCNPGGAGKWRVEYSEFLRGADVIIVVDQDPAGIAHAADVEASLQGAARRVRVVKAAVGKDAADHLAGGHTLEEWTTSRHPKALRRRLLGDLMRAGPTVPAMVDDWLYAGGLHVFQSEPGAGKTWLAQWRSVLLIDAGMHVVYMDEEGGDDLVTERLVALGADPDVIDERFHYYPFPQRSWDDGDVEALREMLSCIPGPVGLGVLDSLPDFLSAADKDEDRSKDVTRFVHRVLSPFRDVGAALAVLDHLAKPKTDGPKAARGRYSRGSGAKLAKADLTILVEQVEEFDRYHSGRLRLWRTKDRRGYTNLPRLSDAGLDVAVTVNGGRVTFEFVQTEEERRAQPQSTGFRPTYVMEQLSRALGGTAAPVSKRTLRSLVKGSNEIVDLGIGLLEAEGHAVQDRGGYRHLQPYRERWDPLSKRYEGEPVEPW